MIKKINFLFLILVLCSCETLIEESKSNHYYYNWNQTKIIYNDHRTWRNKKELDCDITTFEVIKDRWAKDKTGIIYEGKIVPNIDAKSFYFDTNNTPKDKNNVFSTYWGGYTDSMLVWEGADPNTFVHITLTNQSNKEMWAKDAKNFFRKLHKVDGDYATYEILNEGFSKDTNHVYYMGKIIEGADTKTFDYDEVHKHYRDKNYEHSFSGERKQIN